MGEQREERERVSERRAELHCKCIFTYESRGVFHMQRHIIRCTCYHPANYDAFFFFHLHLMRKWNIFQRQPVKFLLLLLLFLCLSVLHIMTSSTAYMQKSNFSVPIQRFGFGLVWLSLAWFLVVVLVFAHRAEC